MTVKAPFPYFGGKSGAADKVWRHTGVLLDPPYGEGEQEYSAGGNHNGQLAADVWAWAIANGDNPLLRIAVYGYEDGRELPPGWFAVTWNARKGYQLTDEARDNPYREIIWFSPHCPNRHFGGNGRPKNEQVMMNFGEGGAIPGDRG